MRLLVTAGPTIERIDAVRFLSNRSSGRFGYAIAHEAARRGHDVTLVSGPVALGAPRRVRVVRVESAREMLAACRRAWRRADTLVMAAAVADFRPARSARRKLPKGAVPKTLRLVRNPDLLATLARGKGSRVVLGFALENSLSLRSARRKLRAKGADAVVLNSLASMGGGRICGCIVERAGRPAPLPRPKAAAARAVVRWIERAAGPKPR